MPSRIHILGGPGAGKSTLARKFAGERGCVHVELDALFWDDAHDGYGIRRDPEERDRRLKEQVRGEAWVMEGVYWSWCRPSFERADQIVLLDTPPWIRQWRLGWRFIKRKVGVETSLKKDSFKSYWATARWNARWDRDNLAKAWDVVKAYEKKLKVIK